LWFNQIKIVSLGVGGVGVGFRLCLFRFVSWFTIAPQAEVTLVDVKLLHYLLPKSFKIFEIILSLHSICERLVAERGHMIFTFKFHLILYYYYIIYIQFQQINDFFCPKSNEVCLIIREIIHQYKQNKQSPFTSNMN
jgi:hypothetical protein